MGPITNFPGMNPNGPVLPQGPMGGLPPGLGLPAGVGLPPGAMPGQGMPPPGPGMAAPMTTQGPGVGGAPPARPVMLGGGMTPPPGQAAPMGGGMDPNMADIFSRMAQARGQMQAGGASAPNRPGGIFGGGDNSVGNFLGGFANFGDLGNMFGGNNPLAQAIMQAKGGGAPAPAPAAPAAPAAPQWATPQWQTAGSVAAPMGR